MYRCRRFIAVLLSLALVASIFIIPVSADDDIYNYSYIRYTVNNGSQNYLFMVEDNFRSIPLTNVSNTSNTNISFNINRFYSQYSTFEYLPLVVSFDLSFLCSDYFSFYDYNIPATHGANIQCIVYSTPLRTLDRDGQILEYCPSTAHFEYYMNSSEVSSYIDLNFSFSFNIRKDSANSNSSGHFYIYLNNLTVTFGLNWFLSFFLIPQMQALNTWLQTINGSLLDLDYGIYLNPKYNTPIFQFAEDNGKVNYTVSYENMNWLDAIFTSLNNQNIAVNQELEQEQKAAEAGALDALDNGFDTAEDAGSFWDLINFFSFASFADYDDNTLDSIGNDSWLDWFSQHCKDDLDSVIEHKGDNDNFISYYDQNLSEIDDKIGSMFGGDG